MKPIPKPVEDLRECDLVACPVWQYANDDELGETVVRPVRRTPVTSLSGRLVATHVKLASGELIWATIENIDLQDVRLNEHYLTIALLWKGKWFTLARYHDPDARSHGPSALARFLGKRIEDVFPIHYDISDHAKGPREVVKGVVNAEPKTRLTRSQIIALAVPPRK